MCLEEGGVPAARSSAKTVLKIFSTMAAFKYSKAWVFEENKGLVGVHFLFLCFNFIFVRESFRDRTNLCYAGLPQPIQIQIPAHRLYSASSLQ